MWIQVAETNEATRTNAARKVARWQQAQRSVYSDRSSEMNWCALGSTLWSTVNSRSRRTFISMTTSRTCDSNRWNSWSASCSQSLKARHIHTHTRAMTNTTEQIYTAKVVNMLAWRCLVQCTLGVCCFESLTCDTTPACDRRWLAHMTGTLDQSINQSVLFYCVPKVDHRAQNLPFHKILSLSIPEVTESWPAHIVVGAMANCLWRCEQPVNGNSQQAQHRLTNTK